MKEKDVEIHARQDRKNEYIIIAEAKEQLAVAYNEKARALRRAAKHYRKIADKE